MAEAGKKSKKDTLFIAIRRGNAEKVARILDGPQTPEGLEPVFPDMEADSAQNCLLHRAARYGHASVVKVLLEKGAEANKKNKFGMTPLHHATVGGDLAVVEALLEESPEEEKIDPESAFAEQNELRAKIAELLLDNNAKATVTEPNGLQTPLHLCGMNGYAQAAKILVEKGQAEVDAVNKISQTPLIYACIERHLETVKVLVEAKADLTLGDKLHWNWTPLHYAVLQDDVPIVEYLLEAGADKEVKDDAGRTAIDIAKEHEKKNVQEVLSK
eukprot:maker-scaffold146_size311726-snap-gene-0.12 protein:Tk07040 transcript:maker-scaffold146_size311726-snap-gene-0.12-mRNA-1 annotation:"hypothetical protein"